MTRDPALLMVLTRDRDVIVFDGPGIGHSSEAQPKVCRSTRWSTCGVRVTFAAVRDWQTATPSVSFFAPTEGGCMVRVSVRWAGDRDGCGSRTMRRAALVAFVLVAFLLPWLGVSSPAFAASPVVRAWGPAPNSQTFTVPAGVTSVSITVEGAPGGSGFRGGSTGGSGGSGARVTGTLPVTPGQTLLLDVGSAGSTGTTPNGWCFLGDASDESNGGSGGGGGGVLDGGGTGGLGNLCGGGGGGGGGADTIVFLNSSYQMAIDAGGGGGGGGGGGIAGFGGGGGGSAGTSGGDGGAGSGPGHGSGGAAQNNVNGSGNDGYLAADASSGGGGGGGGGGCNAGGDGGRAGGAGAGGGGGGGAGHTCVSGVVQNIKISTAPAGDGPNVVIVYTPPNTPRATPPTHGTHRYTIALTRCARTGPRAARRCTTKTMSARFKLPIAKGEQLTLIHRGFVYALGQRREARLALNVVRRLRPGRYTLVVADHPGSQSIIQKQRITIS
jgi:hypothetical protein